MIDFRLAELVWRRNTRFGAVVEAGILVNKWNEIKADSSMIHLAKTLQHGEKATSNHLARFRKRASCQMGACTGWQKDNTKADLREKAS